MKNRTKSNSPKPKRGFMDGYQTYDTSAGYGSRQEWQSVFFERFGFEKAVEILGEDDPLVLFGLTATATWEDVLRAYRALSMKHHPDRGGTKEAMQKINAAFEVLEHRFGK